MPSPVDDVIMLSTVTLHTMVASGIWIAEQVEQQASRRSSKSIEALLLAAKVSHAIFSKVRPIGTPHGARRVV